MRSGQVMRRPMKRGRRGSDGVVGFVGGGVVEEVEETVVVNEGEVVVVEGLELEGLELEVGVKVEVDIVDN